MRILWVTDEVPDPRHGGGSQRQYHLLRRITERIEVDLLLTGHLEDGTLRASLRQVFELEQPPFLNLRAQSALRGLAALPRMNPAEVALKSRTAAALRQRMAALSGYDVVQVEHEWLADLARPGPSRPPKMITLHNLVSSRLAQRAAVAKSAVRQIRLRAAAANALRFERELSRRFDRVITVSDIDAHRIGGDTAVVPNGVDLDAVAFSDLPAEPRMVMTATWSWSPNEDGAVWAARQLLPRVRAQIPGAELVLVGRQPPPTVSALTRLEGVTGHFDVPEVVSYLTAARVAIVPLWEGSGTRIKALEAMAAGRPLVGTGIGLEGLGLVDGVTAHMAEAADDMAARVVRLCTDDAHARGMAAAARRRAEDHHGWDAVTERLTELLEETCRRG